jgi:hypothetical protein
MFAEIFATAALVAAAVWAGDWLRRAITEYRDDENHR